MALDQIGGEDEGAKAKEGQSKEAIGVGWRWHDVAQLPGKVTAHQRNEKNIRVKRTTESETDEFDHRHNKDKREHTCSDRQTR